MAQEARITNVNEYELEATAEGFTAAITTLVERVKESGHPNVLSYRFFVDAETEAAAAIIVYANGEAWLEHHRMAYQWPEMATLQSTVRLKRLTFLGPKHAAVVSAVQSAGLTVPISWLDTFAAGFDR